MALISLEDLEGLDEQLDDDISDNPEPMNEEDGERLLSHWQAIASTHQVSVSPGEGRSLQPILLRLLSGNSQVCRCRNDRTDPGNDPQPPAEGAPPLHPGVSP